MLPVFEIAFSVPVISQIESIGGGQTGRGGWGAKDRLKQTFGLKEQWCAFSM